MTPPDFIAAVAALTGAPPTGDFAVAVSGGPDSLALLLLAHAAFGERLVALTVDHGLRAGSTDEATDVAVICARLGLRHATLAWTGDKPTANLQAAARAARYALMRDWCAAHGVRWLATAHHADDQAETLLMRLARGSGTGLRGIRRSRDLGGGVTLLRPLLGVRRSDLRAIVDAAGLVPVDDPANRDLRFDRSTARRRLAATPWLDPARLAASAAHLGELADALDWTADLAWASRAVASADMVQVDPVGLPIELRRRLVMRALAHFEVTPRGAALTRMVARLDAGIAATLGGVEARPGDGWLFRRARPQVVRHDSRATAIAQGRNTPILAAVTVSKACSP